MIDWLFPSFLLAFPHGPNLDLFSLLWVLLDLMKKPLISFLFFLLLWFSPLSLIMVIGCFFVPYAFHSPVK